MAKDVAPQTTTEVSAEAESTEVSEEIPRSQSTMTGNIEKGKGILTSDNVVMPYPEMTVVAHEFVIWLQFDTSFEIMKFLAL
mgnify:CR=1 FL=1